MTLHAGHSTIVTSDKADLYHRHKILHAEIVLTEAATENDGGQHHERIKNENL